VRHAVGGRAIPPRPGCNFIGLCRQAGHPHGVGYVIEDIRRNSNGGRPTANGEVRVE